MKFRVRGWGVEVKMVGRKGTTSRGETAGQTGPMCVCSAVENNVHREALMRFKNNGDYLYYSLGITRSDVRCYIALYHCDLPVQWQFHVFGLPSCRALPVMRERESHTGNLATQNYSRQNNAAEENSLYRYYNIPFTSRHGNLRVCFLSSL